MKLVETTFQEQTALAYEGLFTQGSGYLHIRGSLEEHLSDAPQNTRYLRLPANVTAEKFAARGAKWGTYVPGIFGQHPLLNREMVNLPWFLGLAPIVDGERLDMRRSNVSDYRRALNLRTATLERTLVWQTRSGRRIAVRFERFVSAARPHLCVQRLTLTGAGVAEIEAGIEADVLTSGHDHFKSVSVTTAGTDGVRCRVVTDCDTEVQMVARLRANGAKWQFIGEPRRGTLRCQCQLPVTIEKRTVVTTSRDLDKPQEAEELSFEQLHTEHAAVWAERWEKSEVVIEGDESGSRAMMTSLYHLLRCHVTNDPRVTIDAKGYAGDAYFGRFFWDTEMYLLPFYLYTDPARAKTFVDFRVQALPGAMANAKEYGYRGARYPWESDEVGREQCPSWQYRDHEVHVTADVVYGLAHYARAVDPTYLQGPAAQVLAETARYWLDRITFRDGQPHLLGVMGPNEYAPITHNNAYTNRLVAFALSLAGEGAVAKALPIYRSTDGLLVWQCEGFDELAEPEFDKLWTNRQTGYAGNVSQERLYRSKALKQADVLMLMLLFPHEFSDAEVRRAWDYYLPYTTHDSSLSAGAHAIVACRLGLAREAWQFWEMTAGLDLDLAHGGAAQGIHIANAGASWLVAVLGFAGMGTALWHDALTLRPRLPERWKRLAFPVVWKGCAAAVDISPAGTTITNRGSQPLPVNVNGTARTIAPNAKETFPS
ncbi:MAG: Kojibiose phosphorylase [Verrucomicrobiae bacterium]|nr:Kojibiose phosphorylase [Verrucomicrobiae bacterium]